MRWVSAVDVVKVYRIDTQTGQTGIQRLGQMTRIIVETAAFLAGDSALGGDGKWRLTTAAAHPVADHCLRPTHTIDIRRIDMGNPQLDTGIQHSHGTFVGCRSIKIGKRHRPITKHADRRAVLAKLALFHSLLISVYLILRNIMLICRESATFVISTNRSSCQALYSYANLNPTLQSVPIRRGCCCMR